VRAGGECRDIRARDDIAAAHIASQLESIRHQVAAGRAEWQDSAVPATHIPVENYFDDRRPRARDRRLFRRCR
jgi:hypothetical protein